MPSIIIYTNKLLLHNPLKFKMICLHESGLRFEEVIKIENE
jgi:hypothetical protein